jgi:molecular chaperone DnaJ
MPGDLFIHVDVLDHPLFQRAKGGHLVLTVPVTYPQLALGDKVEIPTVTGRAVLTIPPGTQPDAKFRLRGLGLPLFNNSETTYGRGDILVQLRLEVPAKPSEEYAQLVRSLSKLEDESPGPLRAVFVKHMESSNG